MKTKFFTNQAGSTAILQITAVLGFALLASPSPVSAAPEPGIPAGINATWAGVTTNTAQVGGSLPPRASLVQPASDSSASLEQHTQGKIIEKFHADNLEMKTALAMFASQNDLNIVPDNDVGGNVTLEVHNLPLNQMMRALLEAGDCSWEEDHGLIRVRNTQTRTFVVNYLRLKRSGSGSSSATLSSSSSGGGGGGGGGGGSGGSGGGGGGGNSTSSMNLTADNPTDFWTELKAELGILLTEAGAKSMAINKTAGIISITDRPSVLKKVEHYLQITQQSINRQVDIETKIYDVTLNDQFQFGIDWNHVAQAYEGSLGFGTATLPTAIGSASSGLGGSAIGGLNTSPAKGTGTDPSTLVFKNMNTAVAVSALKTQGRVEVVAAPRVRTLNNQTAVVKVGLELPFFSQSTINSQSAGGNQVTSGDVVTTVSVGTILSITPQISDDDWITMDISPVLTSLVQNETSPNKTATAPELTDKQTSTIARVRNGTTVVLGGLIQSEQDHSANKVPLLGDIPWLGRLFTGTYHAKTKNELVIFVTPHIVEDNEPSVQYNDRGQNPSDTGKTPVR